MLRIVAADRRRAPDEPPEVALQQRQAGAFDRHVGSRAHGDADIGRRERRGVVDAVAGHGDDMALALQPGDRLRLAFGRDSGLEGVDAEPGCDRRGGRAVVAGQHHDMEALGLERRERFGGARLDRIGDGDQRRDRAVDRDVDDGRAVPPQRLGFCRQGGRVSAAFGKERLGTDRHGAAID